jgi:hypothetical protein
MMPHTSGVSRDHHAHWYILWPAHIGTHHVQQVRGLRTVQLRQRSRAYSCDPDTSHSRQHSPIDLIRCTRRSAFSRRALVRCSCPMDRRFPDSHSIGGHESNGIEQLPGSRQSNPLFRKPVRRSIAVEPLLTAEDVAKRLNVSTDWVWDHSSRKKPLLPVIRMGDGTLRYRASGIEMFIDEHERMTSLRRRTG